MRYVRFLFANSAKYGIIEGKRIKEISGNIFTEFEITDKTHFGVGPMKVGDVVEVKVESIGTLRNYVSVANQISV